jgi:hypothetical protein
MEKMVVKMGARLLKTCMASNRATLDLVTKE